MTRSFCTWCALFVSILTVTSCLTQPVDLPAVTADELAWHIRYLASDQLKGREAGTPECDRAADYIAAAFQKSGIEPGSKAGYFQPFTIATLEGLGSRNTLSFFHDQQQSDCKPEHDFVPLGLSANARVSGGVVFAGYGITAPEYDYDDYAGLDVKGKTVLLLRYEPGEQDKQSPFDGTTHTVHSFFTTKARLAARHGAASVLIVTGPRDHGTQRDSLIKLSQNISGTEEIPVAQITRARAEALLGWVDQNLTELQEGIDTGLKPNSFVLEGVTLTLETDLNRRALSTSNVIGLLPGSDPVLKEQYIVLGAHYDHIGLGAFASMAHGATKGEIHNGADDNASGTAGLLEVAEYLAAQPVRPRRSILFMAFSAEEKGLVGSNYYTRHPWVPLDQTVAMVNLDMIGRLRKNKITVSGVGTSQNFKEQVNDANRTEGLKIKFVEGGNSPSDSTAFYTKNIPVLFFFTGVHNDYHRPTDVWRKINFRGTSRVLTVVTHTLLALANADDAPVYVRNDSGFSYGGAGSGRGAWFGIVPEIYSEGNDGVVAMGVTESSPAFLGGLQEGDTIVMMGAMEIRNLSDMTVFLGTHKPGETHPVIVLRNGTQVTLSVTLAKRP